MPARKAQSVTRPARKPRSATPPARKTQSAPGPLPPADGQPEVVLLAVVGMSPAILTETIWGLAHEEDPVIPTRIIVVTTTGGREELRHLFTPGPSGKSPWDALRQALAAEGHTVHGRLRFGLTGDDIRVITATNPETGHTRELTDLRTPADNEAAANFLLEQVRTVAENPDTRLIASIAGGRKTMSAVLYAAMSLAARETDRVTHVLVNEPFETLRNFWFPKQPDPPTNREGKIIDPATARIDLADIPFVTLRTLFRRTLGRSAGSFQRMVDSCRQEISRVAGAAVTLTIHQSRTEIEVNGTRVRLAPREHLVLLFTATRAKHGEPVLCSYIEAMDPLNDFREKLRATAPSSNLADWRHASALKTAFDPRTDEDLRKVVWNIRDKLRRAGGNAPLLGPCLPQKGRFSLEVEPALIHIK